MRAKDETAGDEGCTQRGTRAKQQETDERWQGVGSVEEQGRGSDEGRQALGLMAGSGRRARTLMTVLNVEGKDGVLHIRDLLIYSNLRTADRVRLCIPALSTGIT